MTIYQDSKRIVGLSTDKLPSSTYETDFSSTTGWSVESGGITYVDSIHYNHPSGVAMNTGVLYDLTTSNVSETSWTLDYDLNITTSTGGSGSSCQLFIGLSNNSTVSSSAIDTAQDYLGHFMIEAAGTHAIRKGNGSDSPEDPVGTVFSRALEADVLYCRLQRISAIKGTLSFYSDQGRTSLIESKDITITTALAGLRYLKVILACKTTSGSHVMVGDITNMKFWNTITSGIEQRPTDVQDNSIMVEKDTARRYWFTPTVEPANSANFDGLSSDHIDIPTTGLTSLANGSVSFWLNVATDTPNTGDNVVFSCSNSSTGSSEWVIGYYGSTNKISVLSRNNGSNVVSYQAGSLAKGTWYHIVYTNSSSTGNKLYINGSVVTPSYSQGSASTNAFMSSISSINTCNIGANKDNGGYQWGMDGNIQQVLVYGSTLTSSEVTALYNSGNYNSSPSATNLLRRYELTSNVNDTSGNGHNGTATGVIFTSEAIPNSPTTTTTAWTWEKEGIRGVFGGGETSTYDDTMDYITMATLGNATDFGNLTASRYNLSSVSSDTRGVFGGGRASNGSNTNIMDYITIATLGDATDFGDLTLARRLFAGVSSNTRGVFAGGYTSGDVNTMDYITIATLGNAIDFGDLTSTRRGAANVSSDVRGIFGGGYISSNVNTIDYITIATPSNATDFGDLTVARNSASGVSSDVRGVFGGGQTSTYDATMDYITIATLGNATDFGDMTVARMYYGAVSSNIRGIFGGGNTGSITNVIDYITITTTGNATDFGDLSVSRKSLAGVDNRLK